MKDSHNKPLISIITAVFNGERNLERTIQSITKQTYPNIEYIIIDGGSTDGTIDIIEKYRDKIRYWISEKDLGIGDAFNKGLKVAKGDYINFQGDGDGFITDDALDKVFHSIDPKEDILISTRIQRVNIDGKIIFTSKHIKNFNKLSLLLRMSLPHQGLFTHNSYFTKYGFFDNNFKYFMDYDHLLRAYKSFPKVITKDIFTAVWRADGIGNEKTLEIYEEYNITKRKNKVANNTLLLFIHYWILFKYYLKALFGRA